MTARERAEQKAKEIAADCEASGRDSRRAIEGNDFAAIGGWNRKEGQWHFVVELKTDEDRADLKEFMKARR